ncbi:MAG: hypothetical protein F4135_01110 [Acidimicrobiia bacterium]|nr:hypothetical protein [Acidimicrobiia bacterium]
MTDSAISRQAARGAPHISLAGMWDIWLGPGDDALAGLPSEGAIELPANWWLRGLDHAGKATFARTFEVDASVGNNLWRLRFEGVDYYCRVWLDGELLGSHEGYFEPFWFDLANLTAGTHRLVVEVDSPHEPWGTVWHMHKTLIKGVFGHHDARPGAGWSREGQARNSGGIWAPVTLEAWPDRVMIDRVVVRARPAGQEDQADVDFCGTLTVAEAAPSEVTVTLTLTGPSDGGQMSVEVAVPSPPAGSASPALAPTATVDFEASARLPLSDRWTTWCRGRPMLYDGQVTVTAKHPDGSAEQNGTGDVPATRRIRTGVRSCSVDESYRWYLNGEEIWIRGTNYIGTYWPSEYTEKRMRQDLELIRDAGINQVRVHAHVIPPQFYDIADELGVMIWQDFPLQWGYTDDPAFHVEAHRQMRAMIGLLGSHPSIVAWCCHNESPWDAPWMAEEFGGSHDPDHNRRLDEDLEAVARDADPNRYVHRNSGTGDSHHYAGWYFGHWEDFAQRPGGPFVTEYGAAAPPDVATLREIIPVEAHAYDSAEARRIWAFHDFQHNETKQHVKVLPSDGLERYVAAAQDYQANLIQTATESYRRGKARRPGGLPADGGPLITGIHHFMAVEGWEALTWAVLDHNRQPKPGYHALRRAMAPLLVCVELRDGAERPTPRPRAGRVVNLRFWLINDRVEPVPESTLFWSLRPISDHVVAADGEGTAPAVAEGSLPVVGAAPDSAMIIGEAEVRAPLGRHRVDLRLAASDLTEPLAANHLDLEVRR